MTSRSAWKRRRRRRRRPWPRQAPVDCVEGAGRVVVVGVRLVLCGMLGRLDDDEISVGLHRLASRWPPPRNPTTTA